MTSSCGMVVLGIYMYTVCVTSASNTCSDLVNSCLHKFQQLSNNPLCGELRDAVNCLNESDMAVCHFSATTHTTEAEDNQTNERDNSNSESYQSQGELDKQGSTRKSKAEINAIINAKTSQNGADSGSHSGLGGGINGESGSQSDHMKELIDVIESAKEEYKRGCNINNMGASASAVTRSAVILLVGVCAAVIM